MPVQGGVFSPWRFVSSNAAHVLLQHDAVAQARPLRTRTLRLPDVAGVVLGLEDHAAIGRMTSLAKSFSSSVTSTAPQSMPWP